MSEQPTVVDWNEVKLSGAEAPEKPLLPEAGPLIMDDERFEQEEQERDQAFNSEPEWKGKPLQPFASSRKSLFYQQRLSCGAPDFSEVLGNGSAFLADAIRILFICSHDPSEYRHLRSRPLIMQEKIDQWGDKEITTDEDEIMAITVALAIFNGSEVNRSEAIPAGGPGREEELGN